MTGRTRSSERAPLIAAADDQLRGRARQTRTEPAPASPPPSLLARLAEKPAVITLTGIGASLLLQAFYKRIDSPWFWFGWVCFVPWMAALDATRSPRGILASALLMNLTFVLVHFGWFTETMQLYTGTSFSTALIALVVAAPILEPQLFLFAAARYLARILAGDPSRGGVRFWYVALTASSVYVAAEWVLPKLFPVTLGYGLYGSRLMRQAGDIAGSPGLTFVVLIGNECVLAILRALTRRAPVRSRLRRALVPAAAGAMLPLLLLAYGFVRCREIDARAAQAAKLTVAAVQANISNYDALAKELGTYEGVRYILDAHYRLSSEAAQSSDPDLIIWPETVYPTTFGSPKSPDGAAFDREIAGFVKSAGRPFIFGSYDSEGDKQFNAAVFIGAGRDGKVAYDVYRKAFLFPFTERVPSYLDFPLMRRWFPWFGTWAPGAPPEPVAVRLADGRGLRVAPLICYDALDPELATTAARQGADMIVTLSNDSWFAAGIAPRLHLRMAAFRSIETHLPQVRATNTGISAAISATGEITRTLDVGERGVLVAEIPLTGEAGTLMVRWGNWFPPVTLATAILLLAAPWIARARRRSDGPRRKRRG